MYKQFEWKVSDKSDRLDSFYFCAITTLLCTDLLKGRLFRERSAKVSPITQNDIKEL